MKSVHDKLRNPVWQALQETHEQLGIDYDRLKCYDPKICPFGAINEDQRVSGQIDQYASLIDDFYIVGERPQYGDSVFLRRELICLQMILENKIITEGNDSIVRLNNGFEQELLDLVTLVLPGYFKLKTPLMGSYYGIFQEGKLVAATGERMKMNGYTEVSGVVTHPEHTGKGYSKQLIAWTANMIFEENKIPFLHVAETNNIAISLYKKLGFIPTRKMSFWNFHAVRP